MSLESMGAMIGRMGESERELLLEALLEVVDTELPGAVRAGAALRNDGRNYDGLSSMTAFG